MTEPFILAHPKHPSIAHRFLAQLRDPATQQDPARFRANMRRLGQLLAYEISKTLPYAPQDLPTPLGVVPGMPVLQQSPVLATVLRAGLPFHAGFQDYFEDAESAFVGAARTEGNKDNLHIDLSYIGTPSLEGRTLILADPMLATGKSLLKSYQALQNKGGTPRTLHIAAIIAAKEGLNYLQDHLPDARFWLAGLDPTLNAQAYIVPGLGDAGDLAFGTKR
ncbi:MAG: uracil phosphoribosyltransferase [Bernardetiaceae bacterium]